MFVLLTNGPVGTTHPTCEDSWTRCHSRPPGDPSSSLKYINSYICAWRRRAAPISAPPRYYLSCPPSQIQPQNDIHSLLPLISSFITAAFFLNVDTPVVNLLRDNCINQEPTFLKMHLQFVWIPGLSFAEGCLTLSGAGNDMPASWYIMPPAWRTASSSKQQKGMNAGFIINISQTK